MKSMNDAKLTLISNYPLNMKTGISNSISYKNSKSVVDKSKQPVTVWIESNDTIMIPVPKLSCDKNTFIIWEKLIKHSDPEFHKQLKELNNVFNILDVLKQKTVVVRSDRWGSLFILNLYAHIDEFDIKSFRISMIGVMMMSQNNCHSLAKLISKMNMSINMFDINSGITVKTPTDGIIKLIKYYGVIGIVNQGEITLLNEPDIMDCMLRTSRTTMINAMLNNDKDWKKLSSYDISMYYGFHLLSNGLPLTGFEFFEKYRDKADPIDILRTKLKTSEVQLDRDSRYMLKMEFWYFYKATKGLIPILFQMYYKPEYYLLSLPTINRAIITLYSQGILKSDIDLIKTCLDLFPQNVDMETSRNLTLPTRTIPNLSQIERIFGIITTNQLITYGMTSIEVLEYYRKNEVDFYRILPTIRHKNKLGLTDQLSSDLYHYNWNSITNNQTGSSNQTLSSNQVFTRTILGNTMINYNHLYIYKAVDNPLMNMREEYLNIILGCFNIMVPVNSGIELLVALIEATLKTCPEWFNKLSKSMQFTYKAVHQNIYCGNPYFNCESLIDKALILKRNVQFTEITPKPRKIKMTDTFNIGLHAYDSAVQLIRPENNKHINVYKPYNPSPRFLQVGLVNNIWSANTSSSVNNNMIKADFIQLAKYPSPLSYTKYHTYRNMSHMELCKLAVIITRQVSTYIFWKHGQLLFLLTRGYPPPELNDPSGTNIRELNRLMNRYKLIGNLHDLQIITMCQLYNVDLNENTLIDLTKVKIHPTDQYIINGDIRKLADQLGLLSDKILPRTNMELWLDVAKNIYLIHRGNCVLTKLNRTHVRSLTDSNISWFMETEIDSFLGIINPSSSMNYERGFLQISNRSFSLNKETTMLDYVDNYAVPMVGYGYLNKFVCFSLYELIQAFSNRDSNLFINPCYQTNNSYHPTSIYSPFNEIRYFNRNEIKSLLTILRTMAHQQQIKLPHSNTTIEELDKAILTIEDRLLQQRHGDQQVETVVDNIKHMSDTNRTLIHDWFENIYLLGWYYRRWCGPGSAYPIYTEDTTDVSNDPNNYDSLAGKETINISKNIHKIEEMMSHHTRELVVGLSELNLDGRCYRTRNSQLHHLLHQAINGNICIRTASKSLIISSSGYMQLIYHRLESIPMNELTSIS